MKTLLSKLLISVSMLVLYANLISAQTENISIYSKENHIVKKTLSNSSKINQELNLKSTNKKIEHVFHITMSKKDCKKLSKTKNIEKSYLSNCIITYNNDTLSVNELELRGKSSMRFKRKSFSVKLNNKLSITKNGTTHKFKKFNLVSLSMDQNYFRNKVAFDLMTHLDLFNLFYTYTEVIVNGKTQGIYLMLQKPKNYAFKKENATFMLRRDYDNIIKKTYCRGNDTTHKAIYEEAFLSIYNELMQKEGKEFYEQLSEILDIEQYFTWMAFNFLIGNKDYTDEVFFFNKASGDSLKFGIMPWDYDDIFYEYPREGYVVRYLNFGDKLAFSSEDDLDFKLISNEYTYTKYLKTLANVIEKNSISVLTGVFELTYQELYPYYCKKDILKASKADKFGKTNLSNLELDMRNTYKWLIQKRETITKVLPTLTKNSSNSILIKTADK